jgi:uncharacterized protein (TIGR02246 family)
MKTRTLVGILSCICLVLCLYLSPSAHAATAEEEILQLVDNFAKAVSNSDFELMSSLYWHSDNISEFEPVAGYPFLEQGWKAVETWWTSIKGTPKGTNVIYLYQPHVTMLKDDVAVTTVYQTLVSTDQTTKEQSMSQFRQTMVVQKISGKWLIVHGHASELPIK